jgi:uncharacterized protein YndB with AHSA1/START domain
MDPFETEPTDAQGVSIQKPAAEVWRALTDPQLLKQWLADNADIDARPGGHLRLSWDAGREYKARIAIHDPQRCLRADGLATSAGDETPVMLQFELEDEKDGTWLKFTQYGEVRQAEAGAKLVPESAFLRLRRLVEPESKDFIDLILQAMTGLQDERRVRSDARAEQPLELYEYRHVLRDCPAPTDAQIDDFVQYVASAHSWYKHLPVWSPGHPFCFFFHPFSAHDIGAQEDGTPICVRRTDDSEEPPEERLPLKWSHYSWMPTAKYRERFAFLDYDTSRSRPVLCTAERFVGLPDEVVEVGTVRLTAVIHPHLPQCPPSFFAHLVERSGPTGSWAQDTGGDATVQEILDLCESIRAKCDSPHGDKLKRLILPERERQYTEMRRAITRVRDLIYD